MESKKAKISETLGDIFSKELIDTLAINGTIVKVYEGQNIISRGDTIKTLPIVLQGTAKIVRVDTSGEEHILFYLTEGDACSSTFSICNDFKTSEVDFTAETESIVLMIPLKLMDALSKSFGEWRRFICKNFNKRMVEFLQTFDGIIFKKMDERILDYLKEKQKIVNDNIINITHQEIATDLSTSRVVVSRLLKQMEKENIVKLYRNRIELV